MEQKTSVLNRTDGAFSGQILSNILYHDVCLVERKRERETETERDREREKEHTLPCRSTRAFHQLHEIQNNKLENRQRMLQKTVPVSRNASSAVRKRVSVSQQTEKVR